jgi:glyoxylase-like metal-dependent hydrolase (beta-lactamase superfamily II)
MTLLVPTRPEIAMNRRRICVIAPGAFASPSGGPRGSRIAWLAVLACSFAVAAASAQRPYTDLPIVSEGKTIRVSPNVYVIPDENRRGVPNVGIVVGSRATLVIDPGMGLKSGQAVLREAAKVGKGTEIYIATTHLHPEHTTGEVAFPPAAKIVRAVAQQQDIEANGLKWVAEFSGRSPELADTLKEVKSFRAPAETFEREKTLDLGGVRVRLIWLGAGHTPGDTAIFVEGDAVLFAGDLAMKEVFPAFTSAQSRADTWLAALDAMEAQRPSHVVGSHYGMGGASMISAYRDFLKALRARVADMKAQGKSAGETAKTLRAEFQAKYPHWDQPSRVDAAATLTYAQLP